MKKPGRKKTVLPALLFLLVAVAGASWFWFSSRRAGEGIRNIILVSIDTCRSDYLSCYGYPHQTSPNIDKFAQEALLFEKVISPAPMTLPSHCSMLTGTIPPYHGVHDNFQYLTDSHTTLAELLKQRGFTTAAFVSAYVLDSKFGLSQGFDAYKDDLPTSPDMMFYSERHGGELNDLAFPWLDEHKDEKFFLFLHYYDPHDPYRPPEPFASRFADNLYAGEIAYTDHCIGQVLDKLKSLGLYDSTLIIITGDHGEMLGEHGENTHGYFVYQSALRVPLIIKVPGVDWGRRISDAAALIDIVPTILSLLKIPIPPQVSGRDLAGFCYDNCPPEGPRYIFTESLTPTDFKCNPLLAIVNWPWKYIYTTRAELYHLGNDPEEKMNLLPQESRRAQQLQNNLKLILEEQLRADQPDNRLILDQVSLDRLRSLGYIGDGVEETFRLDESKSDPKDFIQLYENKKMLIEAISAGKFALARELSAQLLSERPDLPLVHDLAGRVAVATGKLPEAISHFENWVKLSPQDPSAHHNLAAALSRTGQLDQAITHWQEALRLQPDYFQAHENLAETFYKKGDFESALAHWDQAIRLRPTMVKLLNDLAWVLATLENDRLRNPEKALQLARQACESTDFKQPSYLDTLAAAYAAAGQFPQAVETAQKAIKLSWAAGQNDLSQRIQKRLQMYQRSQPYREIPQPYENTNPLGVVEKNQP